MYFNYITDRILNSRARMRKTFCAVKVYMSTPLPSSSPPYSSGGSWALRLAVSLPPCQPLKEILTSWLLPGLQSHPGMVTALPAWTIDRPWLNCERVVAAQTASQKGYLIFRLYAFIVWFHMNCNFRILYKLSGQLFSSPENNEFCKEGLIL